MEPSRFCPAAVPRRESAQGGFCLVKEPAPSGAGSSEARPEGLRVGRLKDVSRGSCCPGVLLLAN